MSTTIKDIKIGKYNEETNTLYPDINKLINRNRKSRKLFKEEGIIKLPLGVSLLNTKEKPLNIIVENQVIPKLYTDDHRPVLFNATGNVLFKNCNIDAYRFFVSDYKIETEITNELYSQDRYLNFENCTFTGKELQLGHYFKDIIFSNNKYNNDNDFKITAELRRNFIFKNENIYTDKKIKFNITSCEYPLVINIKDSNFNLDSISDSYQYLTKKFESHNGICEINIENSNIVGNGINNMIADEINIKNSNIREKIFNINSNRMYIHNSTLLSDSINIDNQAYIDMKNSFIKSDSLKINSNKLNMNVSAINSENCDIEIPNYISLCNSNITGNNTILNINYISSENSKIKSNDLLLITDEDTFNNKNPMFIEANTICLGNNIVSDKNGADISLIEPRNNLVNTLKNINEKAKVKEQDKINKFRENNKVRKLIKKDE